MLFLRTDFGSGCLHRLVRLSFAIGEENTIVEFRRELREGRRKTSEAHIERGRNANSFGKGVAQAPSKLPRAPSNDGAHRFICQATCYYLSCISTPPPVALTATPFCVEEMRTTTPA